MLQHGDRYWFPTSVLPLGLRVDGSYSGFSETPRSVNLAALVTGYFPVTSTVERDTTGWLHSWNAGLGLEFRRRVAGSLSVAL